MTNVTLEIERLGQRGEGIAKLSGRAVFVPFALEGERVLAEVEGERGRLLEVLSASPDRIAPICKYYGVCGGCAVASGDVVVGDRDGVVVVPRARLSETLARLAEAKAAEAVMLERVREGLLELPVAAARRPDGGR